jgi:hypothetical protein
VEEDGYEEPRTEQPTCRRPTETSHTVFGEEWLSDSSQPLAGRGTRCRWTETDGWQWVRREALLHINGESARPGDARECVQWRRCLDLAELS